MRRTPPSDPKACPFCECVKCACGPVTQEDIARLRAEMIHLNGIAAEVALATSLAISELSQSLARLELQIHTDRHPGKARMMN